MTLELEYYCSINPFTTVNEQKTSDTAASNGTLFVVLMKCFD